jgi:hypothetical protein
MGYDEFGDWEPDCNSCAYDGTGITCELRTMGTFSTRECHSTLECFDPPV